MDKAFKRRYSINVARLKLGGNTDAFEIQSDFFEHFEGSMVKEAKVKTELQITKYNTHLDVHFLLTGTIGLPCDRCGETYPHPLDEKTRIIYSFDPEMNFEGYEVMFAESHESQLSLVQELYDFIHMSIPMRKIPRPEIHLCAPEVLDMLGLDERGNPKETIEEQPEESEEADPRWEMLKQLKDKWEES